MRLPSKLLPVLLLSALPLAGCAADQGGDAASPVTVPAASETSDGSGETTDTADPAATADVDTTADGAPTVDAAERDRDESDEGPGTDTRPGAVYDCREVDGTEVCDTFGESDEGPGTYDDSDEGPGTDTRPGAVYDCREVDGTEVCDTFGESDEGPGTYDDSDEGPGTH